MAAISKSFVTADLLVVLPPSTKKKKYITKKYSTKQEYWVY